MKDKKISDKEYENAVETIRKYKIQLTDERQEEFRKSLTEYNKTYWYYKGTYQQTFLSCMMNKDSYTITRFTKNTNGIIQIRCDHKRKEDLEYLLNEMGEYAPDEYELQQGKKDFIFKQMSEEQFMYDVTTLLTLIKISNNTQIKIVENTHD